MKIQRTEDRGQSSRAAEQQNSRAVDQQSSITVVLKVLLHYCAPALFFLLLASCLLLLTSDVYADFELREVKPRIMTVGSLQLNDRIFFRFDPTIYAPNLKLKIFTLDGVSVREISYINDGSGEIFWEGKNADGNFVLPGVYIYQIETSKKVVNGAVVVAR